MPPSTSQSSPDNVAPPHSGPSKHSKPTKPGKPDKLENNGPDPDSSPVGVGKTRPRANSRKEPPTLLTDFFRGKQSPARLAAERKRLQSVEMVKAEMRQEMRQSAVKKLQQPGGVKDRVRKWQTAHTMAMVEGDPDDAATEPTDIAFKEEDAESVTESDRVRIKFRQKTKRSPKPKPPEVVHRAAPSEKGVEYEHERAAPSASPPKKRVVSDEHWRKTRVRKSPSRKVSSSRRDRTSLKGLPSDFVQKSGGNPLVANKVKEWAAKVDVPETPSPLRSHRSSKSAHAVPRSEAAKSEAGDSCSDITARWVTKQKTPRDHRASAGPDKPTTSTSRYNGDHGTGSRPDSETHKTNTSGDKHARTSHSRSKTTSGSGRPSSPSAKNRRDQDPTVSRSGNKETNEQRSKAGATERSDSILDTPTKGHGTMRQRRKTLHSDLSQPADNPPCSDEQSGLSSVDNAASDLASSLANKSIADLPGDIPFGHSAFSELDLTVEGSPRSRPKRPKVDRNTSHKTVPNVFKRVVEESKKIIQEMNEPPRQQVANDPPSIEKWLSSTVDPFVDSKPGAEKGSPPAAPTEKAAETSQQGTPKSNRHHQRRRRRSSHDSKSSQKSSSSLVNTEAKQAPDEPAHTEAENTSTPERQTPITPTSTLRRSRATRNSTSPLKGASGSGKRQLLGALKEAFQGESSPVKHKSYQGSEQRNFSHLEDVPLPLQLKKPSTAPSVTGNGEEDLSGFRLAAPRFRPPTRGDHELSTIVSDEGSSVVGSDLDSDVTNSTVTQSTLTQSTSLTKDSFPDESRTPQTGLKRRLTKHSDLVSVLSLPDDASIPSTIKSHRSRPSLRKHRSTSGQATAQELLREFLDDENMYGRELKTLVDGVVPVLLSHVVNGTNVTELFGPSLLSSGKIPDEVSKSVVGMGVALEKLRGAHKKAPTSDIRKMANWAHGVVPMYNSYLNAWRLGFDDVVVNLAPAADGLNDDESLLAALPRNEQGDVVNDHGEQVAVAYLLKRPLIRVKQLAKLVKCVDALVASPDTKELLQDFETLQNKARRRFKEESARVVDEEAICTDKSRCRDLETLQSSPAVTIDPTRQVSAKDVFSFSLSHSNSQRLDCQVELVHRDNERNPDDQGDLLIREIGEGCRSYLLFPPIPMANVSARTGDSDMEMVIMVCGPSNNAGSTWCEFITLKADNEDQILDWLDILPLLPVPPMDISPGTSRASQEPVTPTTPTQRRDTWSPPSRGRSAEGSPRSPIAKDVCTSTPPPSTPKKETSARYRQRASTMEKIPSSPGIDPDKTPTKDDYRKSDSKNEDYGQGRGRPLEAGMQSESKPQERRPSTPSRHREDGAPPPPIHRTLSRSPRGERGAGTQSVPVLPPPTDISGSDKLKRRGSSPLKHEYFPSDQSSASEAYSTGESEADSSDDDLESIDIPETDLGVSIRSEDDSFHGDLATATPSFIPGSECSLTPSNSASQVGLYGCKPAVHSTNSPASYFMARISRWSGKGAWKDISSDTCCIAVRDGLIEAFSLRTGSRPSDTDQPLLALDLTPLVLIRQSTAVDLEIRSSVQPHSKFYEAHNTGNFRFRCFAAPDCYNLYMAVHQARLNNQKFIQLENEARFKSFGERQGSSAQHDDDGDDTSSRRRRRNWFGRKNSYRSSVRHAPSKSQDGASSTPSSTPSASSFLRRLTNNGNLSFNLALSSLDRRGGALRLRTSSGGNSFFTSESHSARSSTPPRSPSVSVENSGPSGSAGGHHAPMNLGGDMIRIRLHLLVSPTKWEDFGNCHLQIRRPPPGWRQALRADHGLEKRVTATTIPRRETEEARVVLDAVLGSGCFTGMGSRGIVCGVWEGVKGGEVPEKGATGGNIKKWCFQFGSAGEAGGVLRVVHQEVLRV
ncbi:hypothetical protein E4U56_000876 [Claviceps arundinis]|uniref:SRm160/300 splicing coactivator n=1 Tax=Claviceps arundinis TaxID=1623583 RepID=A0A9P7MSB2_9HYPO|nr:hypothetical protein E4U56_000876 [Claviceps arundinis]